MSEVLDPPLADPVTDALAAVAAAVERLGAATRDGLWSLGSAQVLGSIESAHRIACQVDAVRHSLVREADARGAAVEAGASSSAGWLRHRLRMHPAAAKRLVDTARALHDDPAGPLVHHADDTSPGGDSPCDDRSPRAGLRAAFAAGRIDAEHVAVACQTLTDLPPDLGADVVAEAEEFLLEQALLHDPKALARLGRHLRHRLDPDGGDRLEREEQHAEATQRLNVRQRRDGGSDVSGRFGPELTSALLAHLSPLAAPRPAVDGVKDLRDLGQRQADALAELLRRYGGASLGPDSHGASSTVAVTMALETLERRIGASGAWLDWAGPVSAETARRLACDARIIPIVLGTNGEPLDVGRASYPVTQAIWRALVARDGGCSFAGCDRPPEWCQAHHRHHWEDGGETSVANCCLLCDFHHRLVHHQGWDLALIDGVIWTIPPPWVDPARTPRRNTQRSRPVAEPPARGDPRR